MRATRKRNRQSDPLASPEAVTAIFSQLRAALPEIIPKRNKDLTRMLRAARHLQRYSATDTRRGHLGHWKREDLLKATSLNGILERETSSHISLASRDNFWIDTENFDRQSLACLSAFDEFSHPPPKILLNCCTRCAICQCYDS